MASELAMSSEQAESVQFVRELGDFCDNVFEDRPDVDKARTGLKAVLAQPHDNVFDRAHAKEPKRWKCWG